MHQTFKIQVFNHHVVACPSKFMLNKLAVIGAGQMGTGIAHVAAQNAKIPHIMLYDNSVTQLQRQMRNLDELLERGVQRGKLNMQDRNDILSRIKTTTIMEDLGDADFIIEVIHFFHASWPIT